MQRKRFLRYRRVLWPVVTGGLLLTNFALAKPPTAPGRKPAQVVMLLDSIVQPRFQKDAGVFGSSRIPPPIVGHDGVAFVAPMTTAETETLKKAEAIPREYIVAVLHTTRKPDAFDKKTLLPFGVRTEAAQPRLSTLAKRARRMDKATIAAHREKRKLSEALFFKHDNYGFEKAALKSLPDVLKNGQATVESREWHIALRPVRAKSESCLACHKTAKQGDILGVMVYAVGKKVYPEPTTFEWLHADASH